MIKLYLVDPTAPQDLYTYSFLVSTWVLSPHMQCAQACLRQLALYCFDLQTKSWQGYKQSVKNQAKVW